MSGRFFLSTTMKNGKFQEKVKHYRSKVPKLRNDTIAIIIMVIQGKPDVKEAGQDRVKRKVLY